MQHDPLNDAMTTMRNAEMAGKRRCVIRPASKLISRVLDVMREYQYVGDFEFVDQGRGGELRVTLLGNINNCGIIKPRASVKKGEMDRFEAVYLPAQDFGVLIVTTTEGVVSHSKAKQLGVGGKLLAYVY